VRRLFSTFAHGWPAAGLLVMRLAAGAVLVVAATTELLLGPSLEATILDLLGIAGGLLLVLGLWTPVAGSLVAIIQSWALFSQPGSPWAKTLLLALGLGLALVGPGAWSIDARLFGWKRLNIR
jgi:putative oxidoreductase